MDSKNYIEPVATITTDNETIEVGQRYGDKWYTLTHNGMRLGMRTLTDVERFAAKIGGELKIITRRPSAPQTTNRNRQMPVGLAELLDGF